MSNNHIKVEDILATKFSLIDTNNDKQSSGETEFKFKYNDDCFYLIKINKQEFPYYGNNIHYKIMYCNFVLFDYTYRHNVDDISLKMEESDAYVLADSIIECINTANKYNVFNSNYDNKVYREKLVTSLIINNRSFKANIIDDRFIINTPYDINMQLNDKKTELLQKFFNAQQNGLVEYIDSQTYQYDKQDLLIHINNLILLKGGDTQYNTPNKELDNSVYFALLNALKNNNDISLVYKNIPDNFKVVYN